ncbi:MAG: long-chain fatty acid--CoA ligase [Actinobacteria bacterium]|nr:long-chain fatty acid--CoA ligase [Actinomycetota bacterium]
MNGDNGKRWGRMNVGEWPVRWAARYPDEPAIRYGDLTLTKAEFNRRINRLSHAFQEMGVKKGTRFAALMANSHVFLEVLMALSKLGGIMVPLNFRLAVPELEYILGDSEPIGLIYSPEFAEAAQALKGKVAGMSHFVRELEGGEESDPLYEDLIAGKPEEEPVPDAEVTLDDVQFIMYTSGTTGKPKGAAILHGNTQWNAINSINMYAFDSGDVSIACAPLFHIGGLAVSAFPSLYVGATVVVQRFYNPVETLQLIEKERVTFMFGIPVMFLLMTQVPEFETTDYSSVRFFIAGGAPCPRSLIETWLKHGITFNQGYGMTETATAITALRTEDALRKLGSCGKPVFHTDIRVVDAEGNDLPRGEMGEVWVKGPNVIREYWRLPEATAESITDGWLHTGDMGYIDDEGYLYLVDRKKDMYISGGENVYPAEVEDVLMSFEKIADAGVIGIPDEKWGEVGMAVVVPKPGVELSEEEVIQFCRGKLAKYKIPKKVVFAESLPRTATGKILKKELKSQFGA